MGYIPALKYDFLTGLYDGAIRYTMPEKKFRRRLLEQARLKPGHHVLDLGCGTGTLALLAKIMVPQAEITGVDADARVLEIANDKAARAGVSVPVRQANALELPFPQATFDRVLSSLFFHHLDSRQKHLTLKQVFRVLQPGGELHVVDWGKAKNPLMRIAFITIQLLDGFETTSDNVNGLLPQMFRATGFEDVEETASYATVFGTLSIYKARKPATAR